MKLVKAVFSELFALFVDDGSFAALILIWIAVVWLLCSRVLANPAWGAALLFVGLVVILLESAARRSRQR